MLTLTRDMLHLAATRYAGWNKKQLAILGINWPPPKGWLKKLAGKQVAESSWQAFLDASGKHKRTHNHGESLAQQLEEFTVKIASEAPGQFAEMDLAALSKAITILSHITDDEFKRLFQRATNGTHVRRLERREDSDSLAG